jgi:hypothetical protein
MFVSLCCSLSGLSDHYFDNLSVQSEEEQAAADAAAAATAEDTAAAPPPASQDA